MIAGANVNRAVLISRSVVAASSLLLIVVAVVVVVLIIIVMMLMSVFVCFCHTKRDCTDGHCHYYYYFDAPLSSGIYEEGKAADSPNVVVGRVHTLTPGEW